nr:flocculation protein FLO11-like [Penaeus vannamei]
MRHLVTASLLLLAAVGGRVGVRGRPQDMSAEDTHKRYVLAEPPRREAEQRNFSFWGRGASGGGSAERRPNLPWQTSPRSIRETVGFSEQEFGSRLPPPSSSPSSARHKSSGTNDDLRIPSSNKKPPREPATETPDDRTGDRLPPPRTPQTRNKNKSKNKQSQLSESEQSNEERKTTRRLGLLNTDSKTATDNETATSDANPSEYFADLEYQESDLFYDYLYSEYLDEGVDTDTTVPRRVQTGPQDSKDADRGRRQDGADGEVDLKTDNRTPSHKRPPPQRHNLRVHSFQSTFPFESEVRGEGYHSTIRFDPFGSSLPPQSSHYPKSQTYGNWGTTRRPRPVASAEIPGPLPSPVSAAFASAEVYSSGEKLGRLPLAPTEFPRPFPDPSIRASVPDSGFPRPPPARPFLNPGNLAGLLEGDSLGDAITPVSAPADLTTDATPLSPSASREVASGRPSPEDVDIDYPSVANVFADRPSQPRSGEQVAASEANSEPRLEASDRNEADHNSSAGIVPEASVEVAVSTARPPPAVAEDQGQDPAPSQESFAGDSAPPAGSKGEAAHDYDPEYYDNLYDEFMDMYYDQTGADGGEGPSSPPSPPDDHEEQPSRSIPATTASSSTNPPSTTTTTTPTTTTPTEPPTTTTTTTTTHCGEKRRSHQPLGDPSGHGHDPPSVPGGAAGRGDVPEGVHDEPPGPGTHAEGVQRR